MKVILERSHQFIQMGQSGFNTEQNQNDSTLEESTFFQQSNLTVINVFLSVISLSYTKHLCVTPPVTDFSVLYTCHMNWCDEFFPIRFFHTSHPDPSFVGVSDNEAMDDIGIGLQSVFPYI